MKTRNLIIGVAVIGAGFVAIAYLSKKRATAATTTTTAAAAPGGTAGQILGYVNDADQLFNFLSGSNANTSTNSTSGVSPSGSVSTTSPVATAYQDADQLWDLYG